jgi:hypothetical protein
MSIQYKSWILILDTVSSYNWRWGILHDGIVLPDISQVWVTPLLLVFAHVANPYRNLWQGHSLCRRATPRSPSKEGMARNWKRESIPKATENVRMLWRKKYNKAPTVHLSIESTKRTSLKAYTDFNFHLSKSRTSLEAHFNSRFCLSQSTMKSM